MVEATEYMCAPARDVRLVVEDIPDGMIINGHSVTGRELKDLNNAREYVGDVARRNQTELFSDVESAVRSFIQFRARFG
jgi:hypothetical protein